MTAFSFGSSLLIAALEIHAPFPMPAIEVPEFKGERYCIADFGAAADGGKCTAAIAAAVSACAGAGGGSVVVPKGVWTTGAIRLVSNCNLRLEEGAVLEFTDDPADYPEVFTTWEGVECYNYSPLVYAYGCTNVAITGAGTIRPKLARWNEWALRTSDRLKAIEHLYFWCSTNCPVAARRLLPLGYASTRPHLLQFNRCADVLLDGFRIEGAPFWTIHLYHSENCVVRNLDVFAHGRNNDGVDVDMTQNVLIENCSFDQGDDGVVVKAGRNADAWRLNRPSQNIVIRNCRLKAGHSLLGIGSELSGGVRNVWMTRCEGTHPWALLRVKTGPRRGGFVENVWVDRCRGDRVMSVLDLKTNYAAQWGRFPDFELRRTLISNLNVSECEVGLAATAIDIAGDPILPARGIHVNGVKVGRVMNALSAVSGCEDVRIDGLKQLPQGAYSYVPAELKAEGDSAEEYAASGEWERFLKGLVPGDRVRLTFPPSAKRDDFVATVRRRGGIVEVADRQSPENSVAAFCRRAHAGERLTVAFFGGSLTWGANATDPNRTSWRALVGERLARTFPKARFKFVDAAIGGTGSGLGIFRLERDVLKYEPDLVFVDWSVNDGAYKSNDAASSSYEGVLRHLAERLPSSALVQVVLPQRKTVVEPDETKIVRRVEHLAVGGAYGLPCADVLGELRRRYADGELDLETIWPKIIGDTTHPFDGGYALYADIIWNRVFVRPSERKVSVPDGWMFPPKYRHVLRTNLAERRDLPAGWTSEPCSMRAGTFDFLCSRWQDGLAVARKGAMPLKAKFRGEVLLLFGESSVKSAWCEVYVDCKLVSSRDTAKFGRMFAPSAYLNWTVGTGFSPDEEHELEIRPVFKDGEATELRLGSVCVSGSSPVSVDF